VTTTSPAEWDAWPGLAALPPARPPAAAGRLVVVSPHPDDETFGAGGTMAVLAAAGWSVTLVAVTDGEGSHPGSPTHPPGVLAARRRDETAAALAALGLDDVVEVVRLGLPDRAVAEHAGALRASLDEQLTGAARCLTTAPSDGHRDHVATAGAAAAACRARDVPLATFPVWTWLRTRPGDDPAIWARATATSLPDEVVQRKAAAVDAYASQLRSLGPDPADAAVLPDGFAAHFRRAVEVLFAGHTRPPPRHPAR